MNVARRLLQQLDQFDSRGTAPRLDVWVETHRVHEIHRGKTAVASRPASEVGDEAGDAIGVALRWNASAHFVEQFVGEAGEALHQNLLLRGEVVIHRCRGHAHCTGDVVNGHFIHREGGEEVHRAIDHRAAA